MSESTPAALNASPRYLRSAVSHRADDAASGRITPTLALLAAGVAVEPPPDEEESSLPHAATEKASVAATAAEVIFKRISALPEGPRPAAGRDVRCNSRAPRARR